MLYGLFLVVHILVSLFLIIVILLQGGRGGLGETLGGAAAQSLFGGGTNRVMTKITAASAAVFMVTCLSLAALSSVRGRSVMEQIPLPLPTASFDSAHLVPSTALPRAESLRDEVGARQDAVPSDSRGTAAPVTDATPTDTAPPATEPDETTPPSP